MVFFESQIFTKRIRELISDDDYKELQLLLVKYPDAGKVINGIGGIRKVRWSSIGRGKRGGIRVLYYFLAQDDQIYMLFAYSKNELDNLSPYQLKQIKKLVLEELL